METGSELENKNFALNEFLLKVKEMSGLFYEIEKLDANLSDSLYKKFIVTPANEWRSQGGNKTRFFHAIIQSSSNWDISPELDLPGEIIFKHLNNVILPQLRQELDNLKQKARPLEAEGL